MKKEGVLCLLFNFHIILWRKINVWTHISNEWL